MLVGYARTSTVEQTAGLQDQVDALTRTACEKLFTEQTSSIGQRQELLRAIEFVREGDVLIVTKLDRLARSVGHLCELVRTLEQKKVALRILDMGLDTATTTGRLMLNLLGSIAQFEREVMLERQRVGIAKAKAEGKYKGRKPTARRKTPEIQRLKEAGLSPSVIARQLGISRASVYRVL
jgi:DNA invertase Pin-like site-specific DNA recombinase